VIVIRIHPKKVRKTLSLLKILDLTDLDADSRTGSFKGGHEMLLNPFKGTMSETNDTKNGAGTSKQIMS
jgi:hypothetical protein